MKANKARFFDATIKVRRTVFHLLEKLHDDDGANCGRDGMHWTECDALVEVMGFESWAAWLAWERERVEAEP